MSKCKIVLSCEDKSFLGKVVGMIRASFASRGGPIGALETSCEFDGRFTMVAEPFAQPDPVAAYTVRDIAEYVVKHDGYVSDAVRARARELAGLFRYESDAGRMLDIVAASRVNLTGRLGMQKFALQVLRVVDATCEAGDGTVDATDDFSDVASLMIPLPPASPAQLGCIHSAEAIALAGLVVQLTGDHPESRAYKLADKIISEATGVERG